MITYKKFFISFVTVNMLKKIITVFCLFLGSLTFAQVGGEATYQFLNLVSSPRQAALGGKVLTNVDYDVTQALYNPATINVAMDNQLAINYTSYLGGISYGTAAYAYTIDRRTQTFHAGVTYINYGSFEGYDENGNETGTFTGNEAALSMGYALQIGYSDWKPNGESPIKLFQFENSNGCWGSFYETCSRSNIELWHPQHIVRLPNKTDKDGNELGVSKVVGRSAVLQTAMTRCIMPVFPLGIPTISFFLLDKMGMIPKSKPLKIMQQ